VRTGVYSYKNKKNTRRHTCSRTYFRTISFRFFSFFIICFLCFHFYYRYDLWGPLTPGLAVLLPNITSLDLSGHTFTGPLSPALSTSYDPLKVAVALTATERGEEQVRCRRWLVVASRAPSRCLCLGIYAPPFFFHLLSCIILSSPLILYRLDCPSFVCFSYLSIQYLAPRMQCTCAPACLGLRSILCLCTCYYRRTQF